MFAPGLLSDAAPVQVRIFLGQQPAMKVDAALTRSMQAVFPWYTSRQRANEQGSVFLNLDATGCDTETIMRYSHTFYVRRMAHHDMLDKQLTILQNGKPPTEANGGVLQALGEVNDTISARLVHEERRMKAAKERASIPYRRELDPTAPLEPWDIPCMMRCVAEDETSITAEREAKAFLPVSAVDEALDAAIAQLLGGKPKALDKKQLKMLAKNTPPDYDKVGMLPKLRPIDVTCRARFFAEQASSSSGNPSSFAHALTGHALRRFAMHPGFLIHASSYWPSAAGLVSSSATETKMSDELAQQVCAQQELFPAIKFRAQFLYTNIDHTKQAWRSESAYVALPRLLPLMGQVCADDLLAGLLIDSWWANNVSPRGPLASVLDDGVMRALKAYINDTSRLFVDNQDVLLSRALDGVKVAIPPLSEKEQAWQPAPLTSEDAEGGAEAAALRAQDEGNTREAILLPNEQL